MITLILIGLLGGLITAISPCILPVLPVVFLAAGTPAGPSSPGRPGAGPDSTPSSGGGAATTAVADPEAAVPEKPVRNRRPYAVVAGLVLSFSFFTLAGVTIISALGLPDGILRWVGLGLLVLIGAGLIFPPVERLLEKPFSRIPQRRVGKDGSAFVLGLGLGLLYVPCAGPVLAAITVAGAQGKISLGIVALTVAFAVGTAIPLLIFALAGRRVTERLAAFRKRARGLRIAAGVLMIGLAVAMALDVTNALQRALPQYTASAQKKFEDNQTARQHLSNLTNGSNKALSRCEDGVNELRNCGRAPAIGGITKWLNTPGGKPLKISQLHGKVVLIDFWTYSCINCQRSLPHIRAWNAAYKKAGLQIIGVHSPEFAFEKDPANVAAESRKLGVTYPVALDNKLATWDNYRNRYWPAKYLIDSNGTVRYFSFGEGRYAQTENLIRTLLKKADPDVVLPAATETREDALTANRTPETYLNTLRISGYTGDPLDEQHAKTYQMPAAIPLNGIALGGGWNVSGENFTAGSGARVAMTYRARKAYVVLSGHGQVTVSENGKDVRTFPVSGTPTLYPLLNHASATQGRMELRLSPGLKAYSFTFG